MSVYKRVLTGAHSRPGQPARGADSKELVGLKSARRSINRSLMQRLEVLEQSEGG